MKKIIFTALTLSYMSICFTAVAQPEKMEKMEKKEKPEKPEKKEQQEIIIKSRGDKEIKLSVEINGDKVLINGKPLIEFKDDGITINKRKMIFHDGDGNMNFNFEGLEELEGMRDMMEPNNEILDRLTRETSSRPFLGVTTEKTTDGAKIVDVSKGSAAEKAGLKKEDIITKIGDEKVTDGEVLANIISGKKPKEEINVYYKRDGKKKEVKAILGERKESRDIRFKFKHPNTMVRSFKAPRAPMPPPPPLADMDINGTFNFDGNKDMLTDAFPRQKKLGLKIQDTEEGGSVKVIDVEDASAAEKAGLKKDDIITEINGEKISNTDDAREQLQQVADKSAYTIKAKRNGTEMNFDVKIPKKLKTANL